MREPDPRHLEKLPRAPLGGLALDVACGKGRHARSLLDAGYRVLALDVSSTALRRLQDRHREDAVTANLLCLLADVDDWPIREASIDLVVQVDFLDRALLPSLRRCTKPGGHLYLDTFLDSGRPNAQGPRRREFLLQPGELQRFFEKDEILLLEETAGATCRGRCLVRRTGLR